MTLAYKLSGRTDADAETVILSAGLGGSAHFWAAQMAVLEAHFRVLTYDHAGTGENTGSLPAPYGIGDMAADVIEIMNDSRTTKAHIVGHALGGLIGLQIALDAPDRVARLVLVNAWARLDSHTGRCFEARLALLRHVGPEAYVRAQPIFLYPAAWLSAHAERIARDDALGITHFQGADTLEKRVTALRAFDVWDRLPTLRTPTLVAASRDDILVPYTASAHIAAALPQARLWMVQEGGHAFTVVAPDAFNAVMLEFLQKA